MSTCIEETTKPAVASTPATVKTFKFVHAKEVVVWYVSYSKQLNTTIALISCPHRLFSQYFPAGKTRIQPLLQFIKNEGKDNPHKSFFVNLIDSYSIT